MSLVIKFSFFEIENIIFFIHQDTLYVYKRMSMAIVNVGMYSSSDRLFLHYFDM